MGIWIMEGKRMTFTVKRNIWHRRRRQTRGGNHYGSSAHKNIDYSLVLVASDVGRGPVSSFVSEDRAARNTVGTFQK